MRSSQAPSKRNSTFSGAPRKSNPYSDREAAGIPRPPPPPKRSLPKPAELRSEVDLICSEDEVDNTKGKRIRKWAATIFPIGGSKEAAKNARRVLAKRKFKYAIFGLEECPETHRWHLQCAVYFEHPKTFQATKKYLTTEFTESPHVEPAIDWDALVEYCKKDGDYVEVGTPLATQEEKGRRGAEVWDKARSDASEGNFDVIPSRMFVSHFGAWKAIHNDAIMRARHEQIRPTCLFFYGPTGTGKSAVCRLIAPFLFAKNCSKWYDGCGQSNAVLLDDIDENFGKSGYLGFNELKTLADQYPVLVEVKGSMIYIRPGLIFVTSNCMLTELCPNMRHASALFRRFSCYEFGGAPTEEDCRSGRFVCRRTHVAGGEISDVSRGVQPCPDAFVVWREHEELNNLFVNKVPELVAQPGQVVPPRDAVEASPPIGPVPSPSPDEDDSSDDDAPRWPPREPSGAPSHYVLATQVEEEEPHDGISLGTQDTVLLGVEGEEEEEDEPVTVTRESKMSLLDLAAQRRAREKRGARKVCLEEEEEEEEATLAPGRSLPTLIRRRIPRVEEEEESESEDELIRQPPPKRSTKRRQVPPPPAPAKKKKKIRPSIDSDDWDWLSSDSCEFVEEPKPKVKKPGKKPCLDGKVFFDEEASE